MPNTTEKSKQRNWFARHKALTGILVIILFILAVSNQRFVGTLFILIFILAAFLLVVGIAKPHAFRLPERLTKHLSQSPKLNNVIVFGAILIISGCIGGATYHSPTTTDTLATTANTLSGTTTSTSEPKATTPKTVTTTPAAPPKTTTTTAPAPKTATAPAPKPAPTPKGPTILLNQSGSGIEDSAPFLVSKSPLTVIYSYDCSSQGSEGNFIADLEYGDQSSLDSDDQSIANALGNGATNVTTTIYPQDLGKSYHLAVNSECSWTVEVEQK